MPLRESKGNMYEFITHTWNPIKGKCLHDCKYCYVKIFKNLPNLYLNEKELKADLGKRNFIFVGSGTDMFAKNVPDDWIQQVLYTCGWNCENEYLFQSKNPARFLSGLTFPKNCVYGTTIETNRDYKLSKAPSVVEREKAMRALRNLGQRIMITVEPLCDFDLDEFSEMLIDLNPEWINIGADSKGHNLPEPSAEKTRELIDQIKTMSDIEIKIKPNLNRILKSG